MAAAILCPAIGCIGGVAFANPVGAAAANGTGTPFELSFWQSVADSNDRAQYEAYLAQYPDGTFRGLAKAKIAGLAPATAPIAPAAETAAAFVAATPAVAMVAPTMAAAVPTTAPVAVPAVLTQPVAAAPLPGATPASPASPPSLLDQLAAVGKGGPTSTTALFTEAGPVPTRPALEPAGGFSVPDHFCSAVERNRFHDSVYVPAVQQADRNNAATIAHLQHVQTLHDQAMAANNVSGANALAHEATAFKPIADQAYSERAGMTEYFTRIMAAPVTGC